MCFAPCFLVRSDAPTGRELCASCGQRRSRCETRLDPLTGELNKRGYPSQGCRGYRSLVWMRFIASCLDLSFELNTV